MIQPLAVSMQPECTLHWYKDHVLPLKDKHVVSQMMTKVIPNQNVHVNNKYTIKLLDLESCEI